MDGECHIKLAQVAKNALKKKAKYCNEYVLHLSCQCRQVLLSRKNRFFLAHIQSSVCLLVLSSNEIVAGG